MNYLILFWRIACPLATQLKYHTLFPKSSFAPSDWRLSKVISKWQSRQFITDKCLGTFQNQKIQYFFIFVRKCHDFLETELFCQYFAAFSAQGWNPAWQKMCFLPLWQRSQDWKVFWKNCKQTVPKTLLKSPWIRWSFWVVSVCIWGTFAQLENQYPGI